MNDKRLIVGSATADDAGVFRLSATQALVQTVDFFTPIVDDPFTYGLIAAANSLSDVYAMGGRPLTAMNVMGIPPDKVAPGVINKILRGGARKIKEAACVLVGGHTIRNPEPVYGLSVTGLVHPKKVITNAQARAGDCLVLTKPLGTGIITTALKRELIKEVGAKEAVRSMSTLNTVGAELAEKGLVRAGTDVTGFGFLGHLASMCRASGVGAEIYWPAVPSFRGVLALIEQDCIPGGTRQNLETAEEMMDWGRTPGPIKYLLADAQTSGGMLLCVSPAKLDRVLALLKTRHTLSRAVVGRILGSPRGKIRVKDQAAR